MTLISEGELKMGTLKNRVMVLAFVLAALTAALLVAWNSAPTQGMQQAHTAVLVADVDPGVAWNSDPTTPTPTPAPPVSLNTNNVQSLTMSVQVADVDPGVAWNSDPSPAPSPTPTPPPGDVAWNS